VREDARLLGEGLAGSNASAANTVVLFEASGSIVTVGDQSAANAVTLGEPHARTILGFMDVLRNADAGIASGVGGAVRISAADTGVLVGVSVLGTVCVSRAGRVDPGAVHCLVGRADERSAGVQSCGFKTIGATSVAVKLSSEKRGKTVGGSHHVEVSAGTLAISDGTFVGSARAASVSRKAEVVLVFHAASCARFAADF